MLIKKIHTKKGHIYYHTVTLHTKMSKLEDKKCIFF